MSAVIVSMQSEALSARVGWSATSAPQSNVRALRVNKSANTDPHLYKAASPLKVVVRLPLRYAAGSRI
jgi:hypothetical protein